MAHSLPSDVAIRRTGSDSVTVRAIDPVARAYSTICLPPPT